MRAPEGRRPPAEGPAGAEREPGGRALAGEGFEAPRPAASALACRTRRPRLPSRAGMPAARRPRRRGPCRLPTPRIRSPRGRAPRRRPPRPQAPRAPRSRRPPGPRRPPRPRGGAAAGDAVVGELRRQVLQPPPRHVGDEGPLVVAQGTAEALRRGDPLRRPRVVRIRGVRQRPDRGLGLPDPPDGSQRPRYAPRRPRRPRPLLVRAVAPVLPEGGLDLPPPRPLEAPSPGTTLPGATPRAPAIASVSPARSAPRSSRAAPGPGGEPLCGLLPPSVRPPSPARPRRLSG